MLNRPTSAYDRFLGSLSTLLKKAEAHAEAARRLGSGDFGPADRGAHGLLLRMRHLVHRLQHVLCVAVAIVRLLGQRAMCR